VPVLGQLAGSLADGGFIALRYDKRGHGQSGGRAESATLGDHAEDVIAVVRWLGSRRDVDRDRIAIVGHGYGSWIALIAAGRERRIAGVVTIAAPSTTGGEWVLEQQQQMLDRMKTPAGDRDAKIDLQRRINTAVMSGQGWEGIPLDMRKQADTPWFQSLLAFDPARVVKNIRQPLLLLHGDLDREVPIAHMERLASLAREGGRSRSVTALAVRGVNHLLVPSASGEVSEYPSLAERTISPDMKIAINDWLTKTFAAGR
jgi:pimeloyl-ACP methyl ester carboxylesterase